MSTEPLFLDTKPTFKKLASPTKLGDNADNWQKEIAGEVYKQVPFLAEYSVNVVIDRADPQRGYAFGSAIVSNRTEAPQQEQDKLPKLVIPIIVRDRLMAPLDVFLDGKKAFPLSEWRVRERLFRTNAFELSTRKPTDKGLVDQLYPPLRTNYGMGNVTGSGVAGLGMGKMASFEEKRDSIKRPWIPPMVAGATAVRGAADRFIRANSDKKDKEGYTDDEQEKSASLAEKIAATIPEVEAKDFFARLTNDSHLSQAVASNGAFAKAASNLLVAERVPLEKTAEALVTSIKPTVVQLVKKASGTFLVKWANDQAFAPQQATASGPEASSLMGSDRVVRMNPGEAITVTTDPIKKTTLEDEKLEQIRDFGMYEVQNADTHEKLIGWVLPIMDFEMQPMPLYLFANESCYGVQDEIAGTRVGHDLQQFAELISGEGQQPKADGMTEGSPAPTIEPGGMPKMAGLSKVMGKAMRRVGYKKPVSPRKTMGRGWMSKRAEDLQAPASITPGGVSQPQPAAPTPQPEAAPAPAAQAGPHGNGCFVSISNERAMALLPMTIQATTADESGSTSYQVEDLWGAAFTLTVDPNLETIVEVGPDHFAIPTSLQFLPLENPVHLVKDPMELTKTAEAREIGSTAYLRSTGKGEYHLDGAPFEKLGKYQRHFLKTAEAEFLMVAAGMSPLDARDAFAVSNQGGSVKLAGLRTITPLAELHEKMVKKAAFALEKFPYHWRKDLVKEASILPDGDTVDSVLSMGFINPENISMFASALPKLDESCSKLAEMLIASRLGMSELPEGACERSMKAMEEVVGGLRQLRLQAIG